MAALAAAAAAEAGAGGLLGPSTAASTIAGVNSPHVKLVSPPQLLEVPEGAVLT
jgi:hypothetical protein